MAVELEELALVPGEDEQAVGQRLWPVYDGLPAQTVKVCERERLLIVADVRKHLDAVYDALDGTRRFRSWCAAAGFSEREYDAARRRGERRRERIATMSQTESDIVAIAAADWTDPDDCRFLHKSLGHVTPEEIAQQSAAAVITDPPYGQEALQWYRVLGMRAGEWLRPGGSLLVMVGQAHLASLIDNIEIGALGRLQYRWSLAYLSTGPSQQMFQRRVQSRWKPVLWFTAGDFVADSPLDVIGETGDLIIGEGRDKAHHIWGQDVPGFEALVKAFSLPGELVIDPFVGAGTTALACYRQGRRFVGVDQDKHAIETCRKRLAHLIAEDEGRDDGN